MNNNLSFQEKSDIVQFINRSNSKSLNELSKLEVELLLHTRKLSLQLYIKELISEKKESLKRNSITAKAEQSTKQSKRKKGKNKKRKSKKGLGRTNAKKSKAYVNEYLSSLELKSQIKKEIEKKRKKSVKRVVKDPTKLDKQNMDAWLKSYKQAVNPILPTIPLKTKANKRVVPKKPVSYKQKTWNKQTRPQLLTITEYGEDVLHQ